MTSDPIIETFNVIKYLRTRVILPFLTEGRSRAMQSQVLLKLSGSGIANFFH